MISLTSQQLNVWIAAFMWPLGRVLGMLTTAPILGSQTIPIMVKAGMVIAFTAVISPVLPPMPEEEPASLVGLLIFAQQWVVGLALGFVFQMVLAAVEMAGEAISMTSGLGFAAFFDFQTHSQTHAIRQLLVFMTTGVFLAINGHLALVSALVESFYVLPVADSALGKASLWQMVAWGKTIFSSGVQISLPVVTAILIANLSLGILTRAAPQLNLFNIGFSFTLVIAFAALVFSIPYLLPPLEHLFQEGMEMMGRITP